MVAVAAIETAASAASAGTLSPHTRDLGARRRHFRPLPRKAEATTAPPRVGSLEEMHPSPLHPSSRNQTSRNFALTVRTGELRAEGSNVCNKHCTAATGQTRHDTCATARQ